MIDQEYKAACAFRLHALGLVLLPMHNPVDGHCSCRGAGTCGSPAKHPAVSWKGIAGQSRDDVRRMLREYPQHNLGVRVTGSRLVVLDVDPAAGGSQALAEFETRRGEPLPATLTVITGNGGRHLYYRLPDTSSVRGDLLFLHGVDGKASGVMVVPPSRTMSGGEYVCASALGTAPALIPDDVLVRVHRAPSGRHAPPNHRTLHARGRRDQAVLR